MHISIAIPYSFIPQHANLFDHEERATITSSLDNMISHLEDAAYRSADPPDAPFFPTMSSTRTGKPGRLLRATLAVVLGGTRVRGPT